MPLESLNIEARRACDGPWQRHWYAFVAEHFVAGRTVLDVGAGSGYSLDLYAAGGAVDTFGLDPLPLGPRVRNVAVESLPDRSWDLVTAVDVIEHVQDDREFFRHLCRIARAAVFLSTPNWLFSRAQNCHHVREYRPEELLEILGGRPYTLWTSNSELRIEAVPQGLSPDIAAPNFGVLVHLDKGAS